MIGSAIAHFGLARQYRNLKEELLDATDQVLKDGCLMDGPCTKKFEEWVSKRVGVKYCITVHSGTQALEIIALFAKSQWFFPPDAKPNILIPNITYPATLNAFLIAGYDVDLIDTDKNGIVPESYAKNLPFLHSMCMVGLYGAQTPETNKSHIVDGAQHWLIADSNSIGFAMAISFDPTKNLNASGNGGAIVTDSRELYEYARNYKDNGKKSGHDTVGTNSRISELDAAHLLVRSNYINDWQWRRKQIRYYYLAEFKELPIRCLSRDFQVHADQKFVIYTDDRDNLFQYLKNHKIEAKIHYPYALSELLVTEHIKNKPNMLSTSIMLTRGVLSLPIYPELTDGEVEYISSTVCKFFDK